MYETFQKLTSASSPNLNMQPPTFSAFKPRDYRISSSQSMTHVAWNCDGKKLAAVGIDKSTRIWSPEKSVGFIYFFKKKMGIYYLLHLPPLFCRWSQELRLFSQEDIQMMQTIYHGILHILSSSVHRVKRTDGSSFGTHDVCFKMKSSSSYHSLIIIVFYLESRCIQQCQMKVSPVQTSYSPDGRSLLYASAGHQLFFMTLGKMGDETKEEWYPSERDAVCYYRSLKVSPSLKHINKFPDRINSNF